MAIITEETIIDDSGVQQVAHPQTESAAITDATSLSRQIIQASDGATILTKLGASTFMQDVLKQAAAGDVLSKLGVSAFVKAIFDDADANTILNSIMPKSAAAHNSVYRGKDLTSAFNNGTLSKAIAAGTFDDIFPGDYITKSVTVDGTTYSNVKWIIADLDYHLHRGDAETTAHHALVIPENNIGTSYMNSTNTTVGGYQGSYMWGTTIPKYVTGIQAAFGSDHVLKHRERLTKLIDANATAGSGGMDAGATVHTSGEWVDVTVNIPNEAMMFGHAPFASSGRDTYDCNKQLAAFRYGQNFTRATWCWLRDVASAIHFAGAGYVGGADYGSASYVRGVRPYFLLR